MSRASKDSQDKSEEGHKMIKDKNIQLFVDYFAHESITV